MPKRRFLRGDTKFWAPIAIGSGLTIFFFGVSLAISTSPIDRTTGWFDIGFGIFLIAIGFIIAPKREPDDTPRSNSRAGSATRKPEANKTGLDHETYLQERKSLEDALLSQSTSYDKFILTLAAGTFGLSLLFMREIAPVPQPGTIALLVTAWVFFSLSITSTLLSFLFSQQACLKQVASLDRIHGGQPEEEPGNRFTTATQCLNWLSMATFVGGIAFLILFAVQNIFTGG